MHEDIEYWTNLSWPAAPNADDVNFFKQYCSGTVLLLGSTKLLLPLCTEAWDINPKYSDPKIKDRSWFSIDKHFNTIIGDGALVFGKDFCNQVLNCTIPFCDTLVIRSFIKPSWKPKYGIYFPIAEQLQPRPQEVKINEVYSFYIWKKQY